MLDFVHNCSALCNMLDLQTYQLACDLACIHNVRTLLFIGVCKRVPRINALQIANLPLVPSTQSSNDAQSIRKLNWPLSSMGLVWRNKRPPNDEGKNQCYPDIPATFLLWHCISVLHIKTSDELAQFMFEAMVRNM